MKNSVVKNLCCICSIELGPGPNLILTDNFTLHCFKSLDGLKTFYQNAQNGTKRKFKLKMTGSGLFPAF